MSKDVNRDVTVVIRTVGERTTDLCRRILEAQLPKDQVHLISERPHSQSVKRTFEIGIEQNRRWTMAVDADVLFFEGSVEKLIRNAESLSKRRLRKLLVYQGNVYCKLFGKPRPGFHLYNTQFLKHALAEQPGASENLRPESSIWATLADKGFLRYVDEHIYAIHAFEQSKQDCLKNGFFQASKHLFLAHKMVPKWRESGASDTDYKLFLEGFQKGLVNEGSVKVDQDFFEKMFEDQVTEEKPPLRDSFLTDLATMKNDLQASYAQKLSPRLFPASEFLAYKKVLLKISRLLHRTSRVLEEQAHKI